MIDSGPLKKALAALAKSAPTEPTLLGDIPGVSAGMMDRLIDMGFAMKRPHPRRGVDAFQITPEGWAEHERRVRPRR
jgi:hypothetical protein